MPRTGRPRKDASTALAPPVRKRARTPEVREQQLIAAAYDLAEQQIHAGIASAQVITSFLKMGSSRERLEQERMQNEIALMEAKRVAMESSARVEEMYKDALNAMRSYQGQPPLEDQEAVTDDGY